MKQAAAGVAALVLLTALAGCSSSAEAPEPPRPVSQPPAVQTPEAPAPTQDQAHAHDDPAQDPNLWFPRYDWSLEVDGRPAEEALFFVDMGQRKVLVRPELPESAMMDLSSKQVVVLDSGRITVDGEHGTARIAPGPETQGGATFTVEGGQVLFYVGSRRFKITPKQPLEGPATADQIFEHSPLYRRGRNDYAPAESDVSWLRSYAQSVEIVVYFGTWCPHCKVLVPRFMKTLDEAANPRIAVRYVGVPRSFGQYEPARSRRVTGVPCFIFYREGREVGRIPGEPAGMTIEQAVVEVLRSAA
jgi:thiol-disulfide isomerase/thioredoxin